MSPTSKTRSSRFGVLPPDDEPRVSTHIAEIIALIERLIARGHAYPLDGDVYYEVRTFPAYGKLSDQNIDKLRDGARVEVDERKRDPADFALWKAAKPGEPFWESSWGKGRPGWHIECSAMTLKALGATFDIHGGGKDLIFPHHENEIAQSQGDTGDHTFARYWLHNGFLNFEGVKMSKSLGNVFGCEQIAEAVGGEALRFFCVSHHYRSPVDFDVEQVSDTRVRFRSLESADRRLAYFYETLAKIDAQGAAGDGPVMPAAEKLVPEVRTALADDFNSPIAIASLGEAAKVANKLIEDGKGIDKQLRKRTLARLGTDMRAVGGALGILAASPAIYLGERRERLIRRENIDVPAIDSMIASRKAARAAKDFARADAIRGELAALRIAVYDSPTGTEWNVRDDEGQ